MPVTHPVGMGLLFRANFCVWLLTSMCGHVRVDGYAEPEHLLRTTNFTASLDPPDATCGSPRAPYCTLGIRNCSYCDSTQAGQMHLLEYMYDSTADGSNNLDTWWQSWTWNLGNSNGSAAYPVPLEVNMTLSFNHTYDLLDDIILTFENSRPREMLLEKSRDHGNTWEVLQAYAESCAPYYTQGFARSYSSSDPTAVICTQTYSSQTPYANGQVVFPVQDRFALYLGSDMADMTALYTAFDTTDLNEFLQFTDLRIQLLVPATDGLESTRQADQLIRYYYAISNMVVVAGCFCNQHGWSCKEESGKTICICDHNTEGDNCELCKPLYNNRPWQPGLYLPAPNGTPNECMKCECHEHASACSYNASQQTGVCVDCLHNTTGTHCEECATTYYRNMSRLLSDPDVCVPCECESLGVVGNVTVCSSPEGQCTCREHVEGLMCNVCQDNYYGLLQVEPLGTCKACACNLDGTVGLSNICEKQLGQCPCKPHTTGRTCNQCEADFYSFPTNVPQRDCLACACNPGGSNSTECDLVSGQCTCLPGTQGRQCSSTLPNFYIPALDAYSFQPASGTCTSSTDIHSATNFFTGTQFYLCTEGKQVTFQVVDGAAMERLPLRWTVYPAIRYSLNGESPWASARLMVHVSGSSNVDLGTYQTNYNTTVTQTTCSEASPPDISIVNMTAGVGLSWSSPTNITIDIRCRYIVSLMSESPGSSNETLQVDSLVLTPTLETSSLYETADNSTRDSYDSCLTRILNLATSSEALYTVPCQELTYAVMGELHRGPLPCACDAVGTQPANLETCQVLGGQCACKTGVFDRQCTICLPGYYNFTDNGCTACSCDELGSQNLVCDYNSGQCPCLPKIATLGQQTTSGVPAGLRCQACQANHFGYRREPPTDQGCEPCNCDSTGSNSTQCDDSGACTCNPTFGGSKCSTCETGYYAFHSNGCTPCGCELRGSLGPECHATTGQCTCKANVNSLHCDLCKIGTFNLQATNPDGCQPCFCYGHGTGCMSATGYVPLVITAESLSQWQMTTPAIVMDEIHSKQYLSAPPEFLGNRVFAYTQNISVQMQLMNALYFGLDNSYAAVLEGNGRQIYYVASNESTPLIHDTSILVNITLHEDFWFVNESHQATAYELQVVLQNLEGLYLNSRWGNVTFGLSNVQLVSAQPGTGNDGVTYVETCGCETSDHVEGIFCEHCSTGFQRLTINGSSYETCKACNCSSRSATEPTPICDEDTGICRNCRNGTTGDHCEECAVNVISPACEECVDKFWNLSQTGCQPCACDLTGSTGMVCDKVSGQCPCREDANHTITGRQCNQCIDNYYNLTTTGCIECDSVEDTCYSLVYNATEALRDKEVNLTTYVAYLVENDNNTLLGSFRDRLQDMLDAMRTLTTFLDDFRSVENSTASDIASHNASLHQLQDLEAQDITGAISVANDSILEAELIVGAAGEVMQTALANASQASSALTGTMNGTLSTLQQMVTDLQQAAAQLTQISSDPLGDQHDLLANVSAIEDNSRQSRTLAAEALTTARNVQSMYGVTHTAVTGLVSSVAARNTSIESLQEEVTNATVQALETLTELQALERTVREMESSSVDASALLNQSDVCILQAEQLQNQSANDTSEHSNVTTEVEVVLQNTSSVMQQVANISQQSDLLLNRTLESHAKIMEANVTGSDAFADAETMLSIRQNFTELQQASSDKAAAALSQVTAVRALSEAAIVNATSIQQQLGPANVASETAKSVAANTVLAANLTDTEMTVAYSQSQSLSQQLAPVLNDLETKVGDIIIANQTKVVPSYGVCQTLTDATSQLETDSQSALNASMQALSDVETTQSRIATVMSSLSQLSQLNTTQLNDLRSEVTRLRGAFDQSQLADAIRVLMQQKDEQDQQIQQALKQKEDLKAKVLRLQYLRDQLRARN